ncbi:MAG: hypothetical protein ACI4KH_01565 [Oscillospiraceae bacterium]
MKKIFSLIICFSVLLFALRLDINAENTVSIKVGNTDIVSTAMDGISYEDGKLYLNNFTASEQLKIEGIDRIEIVVTGENRIECKNGTPLSAMHTNVTISGGGKLTVLNSNKTAVPALSYGNLYGCAIYSTGMTVTDNTEVFAETYAIDGTTILMGFYAVSTKKEGRELIVKDGARLIVRSNKDGIAVDADYTTIDNGYIYGKGGNAGFYGETLTVKNGGVGEFVSDNIGIYSSGVEVLKNSTLSGTGDFYGAYVHNGDIIISGGTLSGIVTGKYEYANSGTYTVGVLCFCDIDISNGGTLIGKSEQKYADGGVVAYKELRQSTSSKIIAGENCRLATTPLEIIFYEDYSSGESITVTETII